MGTCGIDLIRWGTFIQVLCKPAKGIRAKEWGPVMRPATRVSSFTTRHRVVEDPLGGLQELPAETCLCTNKFLSPSTCAARLGCRIRMSKEIGKLYRMNHVAPARNAVRQVMSCHDILVRATDLARPRAQVRKHGCKQMKCFHRYQWCLVRMITSGSEPVACIRDSLLGDLGPSRVTSRSFTVESPRQQSLVRGVPRPRLF